jgi:isopentenyl diphosphate isomerase/L-lactate dehydrogenase-like FMN-dependent dehydrogenase
MPTPIEEEFQTLHEIVKAAKIKLSPNIWDYLVGATETETTMRRNRQALDSIALRPRVLRDVSKIDCTYRSFGKTQRLPVALAPIGSLESFEPGGGATVAKAAAEFGVPFFLSSVTQPGLEAAADAAGNGRRIFQLYVRGDDAFVDDYVKRARDAGYESFCITVDTAHYSRRERDIAKRFAKPWRVRATGHDFQAAFNWGNVKRFKDKHAIPLILKGIATPEDAQIALEHGVEGIYVSNHGGRQLDHGRGSMAVLPEILEIVKGKAQVIVDGGFSRGTDILKAIALGADLVVVGRLFCYGLAAAGQEGIVRVLTLLEEEIRTDLGLIGATSFAALDKSYLHPAQPVYEPHVHSAFPLLNLADQGY